jgi:stage II sporulation protein E
MFCFDTVTGESCFYKSGAASSFIKRKNSLYRIKSETMPLGIIKTVDAERIVANALDGDTVISVSDGVLGAHEDSSWFTSLVNGERFKECPDAKSCADLILKAVKEKSTIRDDITVAVAKIELI